jgi:transposase-like protein
MRKNQKHTKEEMFGLIQEWESSGISQDKFFQQKGIAKSTFGYWRKKYLDEKQGSRRKQKFIPVKVDMTSSHKKESSFPIELTYPNGVRLSCSSQIDLSRLKTLIVL